MQKKNFCTKQYKELKKKKCQEKKCTKLSVPTAERNAKFPSSQTEADQYIAVNVILNEDHQEDIKLIS